MNIENGESEPKKLSGFEGIRDREGLKEILTGKIAAYKRAAAGEGQIVVIELTSIEDEKPPVRHEYLTTDPIDELEAQYAESAASFAEEGYNLSARVLSTEECVDKVAKMEAALAS